MVEQRNLVKHTHYIIKYAPESAKNNKTKGAGRECLYNFGKLGYHFNAMESHGKKAEHEAKTSAEKGRCTMSQTDIILDGILDAGEILLKAGAEISRVEDTVHRMSVAYGFVRADVFVITSNIVVTVHTEDGSNITQTRRITGRSTNMRKIEQVNALSRKVCANPIPAGEFREAVADISRMPACSNRVILAAYLIIASAFAVFFGGTIRDGAAAAVCSLVPYGLSYYGEKIRLQPIILIIVESAAICLFALFTVWIGLGSNINYIIIGNIMLLIPGVALMTAVRDMIMGETISGVLGICEAVVRAIAIAIGCAMVLLGFGVNL